MKIYAATLLTLVIFAFIGATTWAIMNEKPQNTWGWMLFVTLIISFCCLSLIEKIINKDT